MRRNHGLDVESRCAVLLDECARRGVPRWIALNLALVAMRVRPAVLVQSIDDDFGPDFASGVRSCAAAIRASGVPLTHEVVDKGNGETDAFFLGPASRPLFDAGEPARLVVDEAAAVQILREAWHAVKALRGEAPRVDEILFPKRRA